MKKGDKMISVKTLKNRAEQLFKKADEIQDKWKHGEVIEKELNKMNRLYTEALAITITLKATGNI